jgi:polyferredoxin
MGDHAALRFDIPNRKFHLFGITLLASDSSYLLFLFGSVVFSVFLVTALWGRAWCGWACPQTVFLESIIRPIEALIEGSPRTRARLDQGPLTAAKVWKKGLKFAVYLMVAGAVGTTVVAYFIGREGVLDAQFDPRTHPAGTAFLSPSRRCSSSTSRGFANRPASSSVPTGGSSRCSWMPTRSA